MGYGDLSSYGHPYSETPNLDRLASEGTSFTRVYVNAVVCCPSRASLLSGRYAWRYGSRPDTISYYGLDRAQGQVTVTELLHDNGYHVGHVAS